MTLPHHCRLSLARRRHRTDLLIVLILLFIVPPAGAQQSTSSGNRRLTKIEFIGLQSVSDGDAVLASGLQLGQTVDDQTFDVASQRLVETGLFKKLSYRFRTLNADAEITFEVEEEKGAMAPVVFDNFVWFSDEELIQAIKQRIPTFRGLASDRSTDAITNVLLQVIQERQIQAGVEYIKYEALSAGSVEHIFGVEGLKLPICSVDFPGAIAVDQRELIKASKPLLTDDYRRSFTKSFAQVNLIPIYREKGHLRVGFRVPAARPTDEVGKCKGGVAVSIPVDEGPSYLWSNPEWSGNKVLTTRELESALGMKVGVTANGVSLDQGVSAIREAYGKHGYLATRLNLKASFDDAVPSVKFLIHIVEGEQYRMGELTLSGFSAATINRLKKRWKLQPGDVYDDSYLSEFLKKEIVIDAKEAGNKSVKTQVKADRQQLIVAVSITLQ